MKFNGNVISMIYMPKAVQYEQTSGLKLSYFFIQLKCIRHISNTNNCSTKQKGLISIPLGWLHFPVSLFPLSAVSGRLFWTLAPLCLSLVYPAAERTRNPAG